MTRRLTRQLSRSFVAAVTAILLQSCAGDPGSPTDPGAPGHLSTQSRTVSLGLTNVLNVDQLSEAVAVTVPMGELVTVQVTGAIFGQDVAPDLEDPLAGVLVVATTDQQDGSALEAALLPGTHFYSPEPKTWSFTMNSGSDRVYLVAINQGTGNLAGQYDVVVNGLNHTLTTVNVVNLDAHPAVRRIRASFGATARVDVAGSIKGQDLTPALRDPLAGVLLLAVTNLQDGSASEGWVMPGTHFYNKAPQGQSFTLNSGTDQFYAVAINGGTGNLFGSYTLTVR